MKRPLVVSIALALLLFCVSGAAAAEPLKILIVDGQNNHNWPATTPILQRWLEESGRFAVEVATSPPGGEDLSGFLPEFAAYDAVVSNYNGAQWSDATQQALVEYVRGGGGLAVIHAANNAFPHWPEYNEMIGLGWRGSDFGDRVTFDEAGAAVRVPQGEGPGAGHGAQHAFVVETRDAEHAITAGLPARWLHVADELYHGQRGPAQNMHVLASAFSSTESGGTGEHEPMIWVIPYGEGRVFTSVLGHSPEAMHCTGFITTYLRGVEWAATGEVTLTETPADFPTADEERSRE